MQSYEGMLFCPSSVIFRLDLSWEMLRLHHCRMQVEDHILKSPLLNVTINFLQIESQPFSLVWWFCFGRKHVMHRDIKVWSPPAIWSNTVHSSTWAHLSPHSEPVILCVTRAAKLNTAAEHAEDVSDGVVIRAIFRLFEFRRMTFLPRGTFSNKTGA